MSLIDSQIRPLRSLAILFIAYKAFLVTIALSAPGSGYDTSTNLFLSHQTPSLLSRQLTRWDALYFIQAARQGKVYEQEWAFGEVFSLCISNVVQLCEQMGIEAEESLVGIGITHISHLISVLALHKLTLLIFNKRLAFVAAVLHILTPGGLFLSAPYAEAPFSALSFIGNWLFALSHTTTGLKQSVRILMAGVVFGVATCFRSNGLASGLLFAVETLLCTQRFIRKPTLSTLFSMVPPVFGGLCVAAGSIIPQYFAWTRYCVPGNFTLRPWCSKTIPSIYSFVQDHYWNVGFLRYWTLPQVPLFLLATPVLTLLITSGIHFLLPPTVLSSTIISPTLVYLSVNPKLRTFIRTLALSQTLVAMLAITHYHVQVITRLASGYAVWYWWIAGCLVDNKGNGRIGWGVVVFMVMYGGVQGALFASFLPPA